MQPDPATTAAAVTFLLAFTAITPAHWLADHWLQTEHQVIHKGDHDWRGRWACARHSAVHVLTTIPFLLAAFALVDGVGVSITGLVAGQAWTFGSHYLIDRRWTVSAAARALAPIGKARFHNLGEPRSHLTVVAERRVAVAAGDSPAHEVTVQERVPLDRPVLGTGRYALDQSAHHAALFVTALLTATL
ncbi:hypothetical protein [Actinosynnema sp. NPDC023587]|uniref:hypothetical protein n=1 Tax=Actinosynnema sp. NPDC023587 TaxID=3154695 RepID=UPI003406710B